MNRYFLIISMILSANSGFAAHSSSVTISGSSGVVTVRSMSGARPLAPVVHGNFTVNRTVNINVNPAYYYPSATYNRTVNYSSYYYPSSYPVSVNYYGTSTSNPYGYNYAAPPTLTSPAYTYPTYASTYPPCPTTTYYPTTSTPTTYTYPTYYSYPTYSYSATAYRYPSYYYPYSGASASGSWSGPYSSGSFAATRGVGGSISGSTWNGGSLTVNWSRI